VHCPIEFLSFNSRVSISIPIVRIAKAVFSWVLDGNFDILASFQGDRRHSKQFWEVNIVDLPWVLFILVTGSSRYLMLFTFFSSINFPLYFESEVFATIFSEPEKAYK
jgi:hypothetical protein